MYFAESYRDFLFDGSILQMLTKTEVGPGLPHIVAGNQVLGPSPPAAVQGLH